MVRFIESSQKTLLSIFVCFLLVQCSSNSTPEQVDQPANIFILDEIPPHIQEVENLTIFPGDSKPAYSIELIPEQTYGETGEPYLTRISEMVIDNQGRIIISDASINTREAPFIFTVYAFNADGTYHIQIGNKGRGPGDYGMILGLQAKAGKIFVLDYTTRRINVYNTNDYSFEQQTLVEQFIDQEAVRGLDFGYFEVRNDGNIIMIFYKSGPNIGWLENTYRLVDIDGNVLNFKPLSFPYALKIAVNTFSQRPSMPLRFMGETITAISNEDELYLVWTRDFLIKKYDVKGVYQSAFYYPVEGSPFDLDEYLKTAGSFTPKAHQIRSAFDKMNVELPKTYPIIEKMMVDDENRIWVAVSAGLKNESYEWWILQESGELLAKLLFPRDQPIYDIKNGYLYSKEMNEETGAEYVVKYRIELKEN